MADESARLNHAVGTAIGMMRDDDAAEKLEAHCRWELRELMKRVKPSDCTAMEVMAILAVLAPVHARVLGVISPLAGPVLTLLRDPDSSPDFRQQVVGGDQI